MEDDPLVEEVAVRIADAPQGVAVHVLQHTVPCMLDARARVRSKAAWAVLQTDVPLPTPARTALRTAELGIDHLRLSGGPTATACDDSRYYVARRVATGAGDTLVLVPVPVENMTTMRPLLAHVDDAEARSRSSGTASVRSAAAASPHAAHGSPQGGGAHGSLQGTSQVQFRRRETEQQIAARLSSHAHMQRQVDETPWVEMRAHHGASTAYAASMSERLFGGPIVKADPL